MHNAQTMHKAEVGSGAGEGVRDSAGYCDDWDYGLR